MMVDVSIFSPMFFTTLGSLRKTSFTYNAERVLGSGSFGVVYQAQVGSTSTMYDVDV